MRRIFSTLLTISVVGLLSPVVGQSIPAKGTPNTFDVATWNIEWFGGPNGPNNDEQQILNAIEVFRNADIDLWALQEIADTGDFSRVLDSLGSTYSGFLASIHNGGENAQRIGFLYNNTVVRLISQDHILESFSNDFAGRPPLQMEAEVTIGDSSRVVTFITVHMKAFSDIESYNKRLAASGRLKNHIDFTTLEDEAVIILGDFNDELESSITFGQQSPYKNFLDDTDDYFFPTLDLEQDNRNSWCSSSQCTSGSTIDHILITSEMLPFYVSSSSDHYDELLSEISSYTFSTSDHLPIFARFDINRPSSVENDIVAERNSFDVYPNPFDESFSLRYDWVAPYPASVDVLDVTGRRILEQSISGDGPATIKLGDQPSGVYFVRLTSGGQSVIRQVVKI